MKLEAVTTRINSPIEGFPTKEVSVTTPLSHLHFIQVSYFNMFFWLACLFILNYMLDFACYKFCTNFGPQLGVYYLMGKTLS